jgi:hypothetical protein
MTVQERLELFIGKLTVENAVLASQLDEARAELARRDAATEDANAVRVDGASRYSPPVEP